MNRSLGAAVFGVAILWAAIPCVAEERGRQHYVLHCAGCHQFDGSGSAPHEIPDLKGSVGHFLRIPEGRAFLVQVPGTSNSALSDAQIAVMLNWMLPQFSGAEMPADFAPYTADEVTRLRRQQLDDVAGARSAIVKRLSAMGYRVSGMKDSN